MNNLPHSNKNSQRIPKECVGLHERYRKLSPDQQRIARKLIRAILDVYIEEEVERNDPDLEAIRQQSSEEVNNAN